jgi:2-oxoisovalerate dehydrogenase E1 component
MSPSTSRTAPKSKRQSNGSSSSGKSRSQKKPKRNRIKRSNIEKKVGLSLYEAMLRTYLFEDRLNTLYRQGELFGGLYTGSGNEAVSAAAALALAKNDIIGPSHRGIGVHFARGVSFKDMMLQLMARGAGGTKGRDNAAHQSSPELGVLGNISHMGAWTPVAAGCALAGVISGEENVALSFIGDGSSSLGIFHETLNCCSVLDIPFILVIENNQYAYSTPNELQFRCENLSDRAIGYGIDGCTIDGTDVELVYQTIKDSVEAARKDKRPRLIETRTMRMRGHSAADEGSYVPKELLEEWQKKDPITQYEKTLLEREWITAGEIDNLREQITSDIETAVGFAKASPLPEVETVLQDVYADTPSIGAYPPASPQIMTYLEAIRETLLEEMRSDESIFCIGEDIGNFGGPFKITKDFLKEFGRKRVIDTPIAENGFVGLAIGAALWGKRPVVEIQFSDFVTEAFTQIVYNAAKMHYRTGMAVPMVLRMPVGAGMSAGPFHSANPESWFCHVPGLKVVAPGTVADARGLMRAAIRDNNPVIFLEHKFLYRRVKEQVEAEDAYIPIGKASVDRQGDKATVITYGASLHRVREAAEQLSEEGMEIEIINLRSLLPWDRDTVFDSIRKTGRALVVHEAPRTAGFGGEILSEIAENMFEYLDAPPQRLASHDTPVPFAPNLEQFVLPSVDDIVFLCNSLIEY